MVDNEWRNELFHHPLSTIHYPRFAPLIREIVASCDPATFLSVASKDLPHEPHWKTRTVIRAGSRSGWTIQADRLRRFRGRMARAALLSARLHLRLPDGAL